MLWAKHCGIIYSFVQQSGRIGARVEKPGRQSKINSGLDLLFAGAKTTVLSKVAGIPRAPRTQPRDPGFPYTSATASEQNAEKLAYVALRAQWHKRFLHLWIPPYADSTNCRLKTGRKSFTVSRSKPWICHMLAPTYITFTLYQGFSYFFVLL